MKKLIIALMMLSLSAQATVKHIVEATGNNQNVRGYTGTCSMPLLMFETSFLSLSSTFTHSVCKEYLSYDEDVTGPWYHHTKTKIAGTEVRSYRLEPVSDGPSQFLSGRMDQNGRQHNVNQQVAAQVATALVLSCSLQSQQIESMSLPLQETACANQH